MKIISKSLIQTKNLAKKLAKDFKNGQVLGLIGNLGSGKTQFTKGLAEYFKIKSHITSPTFVLLRPYPIPRDPSSRSAESADGTQDRLEKLVHIDCYRLDNPEELLAIGLEEYLNNPRCITVIEWAEKVRDILPKDTIWIEFKMGKKENERIISVPNLILHSPLGTG